jgi:cell division protease FtsH
VGHVREAGPPDLREAGGAHLPRAGVRRQQDYSEETAVLIDAEVKQIILDSAARARSILEEQIARLHRLAKALLEHESLDAEEITRVLAVEPHGALEGAPA